MTAFEAGAVNNRHAASVVVNESGLPQDARGERDTGTLHAQHQGEEFMPQRERVRSRAVMGNQQPATAALLERVQPVTRSCLSDLADRPLEIVLQQHLQWLATRHRASQRGLPDAKRLTRDLHDRVRDGAVEAEECAEASNALDADRSDLGSPSITHRPDEGGQAAIDEINVLHWSAGPADDLATGQFYPIQAG